MGDLK